MEIFGYSITRKERADKLKNIVLPQEDGAIDTFRAAGANFGTFVDLDTTTHNEMELIRKYRTLSLQSDVDIAIEDIVTAAIANTENEDVVRLDLRKVTGISSSIKKKIEEEFDYLLRVLKFNNNAQEFFRRWYIDGRIYFHKIVDSKAPEDGILDIRYIDPRKIKKIRNIIKEKDAKTGVEFIKSVNEYYVFNERGLSAASRPANLLSTGQNETGITILKDAICFVPSGVVDVDNNNVLSYLHKALRPANQLRMQENAVVIYRLARAPERRIFYVDVGNLPKLKAEQYLADIIAKYRNKLVYDANTGEIRDDKKFMSMLEDIWLPRREGSKGTEISTLPGGQNLGEMADVEYFQKKLYEALNVPFSHFQNSESSGGLNFGKGAEITRDELKYHKFVQKLLRKFAGVFNDLLRTQLILKNIVTQEDWELIEHNVMYVFAQDSYYTELKKLELFRTRGEIVSLMDGFVDKYYSRRYIQTEVLGFSDEQIVQMDKEMGPEIVDAPPPPPLADNKGKN
jgi:hypothetical protein